MSTPSKKRQKRGAAPQPAGPVQINLRVSDATLAQLDEWVEAINAVRGWPKLTRTDVLRRLLERGLEERPEWVGK